MADRTPSADLIQRFIRILGKRDESLSIVLRSHLLLEEQLRLVVDSLVAVPEHLKDARLSFDQVRLVAAAILGVSASDPVWIFLKEINKLRNKVAHQAEPADVATEMRRLILLLETSNEAFPGGTPDPDYKFTVAVSRAAGEIEGRRGAAVQLRGRDAPTT